MARGGQGPSRMRERREPDARATRALPGQLGAVAYLVKTVRFEQLQPVIAALAGVRLTLDDDGSDRSCGPRDDRATVAERLVRRAAASAAARAARITCSPAETSTWQ